MDLTGKSTGESPFHSLRPAGDRLFRTVFAEISSGILSSLKLRLPEIIGRS